jgi:dienelactone hydrolase
MTAVSGSEPAVPIGRAFEARDTLTCGDDPSEDARQCLAGLSWNPASFTVRCEEPVDRHGDALLRFPSPVHTGNATNDEVAMEWYVARDSRKRPVTAPAVVVVHESGRAMPVGRLVARGLQLQQLHALLIQLPGYGVRKSPAPTDGDHLIASLRQAVADVRRARDAVAALPLIDTRTIGLQGTSLGGFVSATTAGLDRGYQRVFILLAGGNLHEVIERGQRDAASLRDKLKAAGVEGAALRDMTRIIEPMRLAHRLDPRTTWLYSGQLDDVVPPACSRALATAARLPEGHHIELPVDHYSGIILLPKILLEIRQAMEPLDPPAEAP